MSGMTVEYIIGLVDNFSGEVAKVWQSANKTMQQIQKMGEASIKADLIMADWAKNAVINIDKIGVAASRGAAQILKEGDAIRANSKLIAEANALNNRMNGPPRLPREGAHTTGYSSKERMLHGVVGGKLMNAYFGLQIGEQALHAVDSLVDIPAEVDTLMKKGHMKGISDADLQKMRARSEELSKENPNMSIAENMNMIMDMRTNMIGSFDEILKDAGAFSELGSFFKAWDAKSGGGGKDLLKELNTAIRSGELGGNTTGEELAKHAQALAAMKILYGDRLSADTYFTSQKAAGAIFPALDEQFKFVDFPALVNRMGSRAGVGLLSMMQKDIAGINVRPSSADEYRRLGLVDDSKVTLKKGHVEKGSMQKGWLKGSDQLGQNPEEWMMRTLLPAIAKGGSVRGLDDKTAERMVKEWQAGDSEGLRKDLRRVNKADLFGELGKLSADRTGTQELMQGITAAPMVLRDRQLREAIAKDLKSFDDWNRAKQEIGVAMNNTIVKMTGDNAMNNVISGMHKIRDWINKFGDFFKSGNSTPLLDPPKGSPLRNWLDGQKSEGTDMLGFKYGAPSTTTSPPTTTPPSPPGGFLNNYGASAAALQAATQQVDVTIKAPETIRLDFTGTVNASGMGRINGGGAIPLSPSWERGKTAPDAPAPRPRG